VSGAPTRSHTGGCQCGAVRFRSESLGRASVCHCRMCQKASGSVYGAFVNARDITWTRGALSHFQSSQHVKRGFCRDCGTPLTFEYQSATAVSIAAFDRAAEITPIIQMGRASRLPWGDTVAELPLHPEAEVLARQARLATVVSYQHPDHDTDVWPPVKTNS
jgi:hypothetical protein